jgi:hypothetical protein
MNDQWIMTRKVGHLTIIYKKKNTVLAESINFSRPSPALKHFAF